MVSLVDVTGTHKCQGTPLDQDDPEGVPVAYTAFTELLYHTVID